MSKQLSRTQISTTIDTLYRSDSSRVLATLVRLLGDLDLAEEAMHEAFAAALESWHEAGIPDKPRPWLISTARFKAIDGMRRRALRRSTMPWGLKRYYGTGGLHFITWSCYRRRPLLDTKRARDLLLTVLELIRGAVSLWRHRLRVWRRWTGSDQRLEMVEAEDSGEEGVMGQLMGWKKPHFSRKKRARNGAPGSRRFRQFKGWAPPLPFLPTPFILLVASRE